MDDRLYRSRSDRMLAGVAGGLAEMWGADPSLVRVVWALLIILTGGVALVVYIVMAIVVPEGQPVSWPPSGDPATSAGAAPLPGEAPVAGSGWTTTPPRHMRAPHRGEHDATVPVLLGAILVLLGGFFLVREFLPQIDFDWFWPATLIVVGVVILISALRRDRGGPGATS